MSEHEQEEWIVVKPRKNKRIEKEIKPERIFFKGSHAPLREIDTFDLDASFLSSAAFQHNHALLAKLLDHAFDEVQVHCLGLGNFSSQLKPYLQLLFLKHHILSLLDSRKTSFTVNVFDPAFSPKEVDLVKTHGWTCEQLGPVKRSKYAIFYMPHCERFLHEQVCALKQQSPGNHWIVIGNSIREYKQRSQMLGEQIPASFEETGAKQQKIMDFKEAFNDTYAYVL